MRCSFYCLEYVSYCTRYNTSLITLTALHRMCLTRTCLAISEYCSIIPLKYGLYNRQCSIIKDWLLFACWGENRIKCEITNTGKIGLLRVWVLDSNSTFTLEYLNNELMIGLFGIWWSTTHNNLDCFSFRWCFNFWWHWFLLSKV